MQTAQTATIENRFVVIPETAPWLAEYLHEMTVFPKGKHDDPADSTAQFLDWFKRPFPGQGFYELTRIQAEAITQRTKPQPVEPNWAIGSMEWQAEQEKPNKLALLMRIAARDRHHRAWQQPSPRARDWEFESGSLQRRVGRTFTSAA